MNRAELKILRSGALTSVQDLGRTGFQHIGVTPGGAMDWFAASVANLLVGNTLGEAVLEMTLLGPEIRVESHTVLSLSGADLKATLDGVRLKPWSSFIAPTGSVLRFEGRITGARGYLGILGGLDVPVVMGSRSTDIRSKIGGLEGRPIKRGDKLCSRHRERLPSRAVHGRSLNPTDIEQYYPINDPIRIVCPAINEQIETDTVVQFCERVYSVRPDSDRMGYRFDGEPINTRADTSIWSEPTALGTVQLLPSGLPIVLMVDRQTVGGYPKIGAVVTVDVPRIAQAAPGDTLRFDRVEVDEAVRLLDERRRHLQLMSLSNL